MQIRAYSFHCKNENTCKIKVSTLTNLKHEILQLLYEDKNRKTPSK